MLKDKLNEALSAAQTEGNDQIVSLLEQALSLLPVEEDGGVVANSGGGGHGDPDKQPGG